MTFKKFRRSYGRDLYRAASKTKFLPRKMSTKHADMRDSLGNLN
jgi:hypothetical protein